MRVSLLTVAAALLVWSAAGAVLYGQEASQKPSSEKSVDSVIDVLVTASRLEESREGIPGHVTVLDRDDIERYNVSSVTELLEYAAGVRFRSTSESPLQTQATMRGFGQGRVLILVDGKRLNNPDLSLINWFEISLGEVERVEVLHGPHSVTYGDNAVAGVINIVTRPVELSRDRPVELRAESEVGSFGKVDGSVGVTTGAGPLALSASYDLQRRAGQRERSESFSQGGSVDLSVTPGSIFEITLASDFTTSAYQLAGAIPESTFEDDPNEAQYQEDEAESTQLGAQLTLAAGDERWNAQLPAYYTRKRSAADITSFSSFSDTTTDTVELKPFVSGSIAAGSSVLLELRGGVDLLRSALAYTGYLSEERNSVSSQAELEKASGGAWAESELSWRDIVIVTAGGRYELGRITADSKSNSALEGAKEHTGTALSAGLLYRPVEGLELFSNSKTLYRYPFLDEQVSYQGFGADFLSDLEAEHGYSVDLGARFTPGTRVSIEGSVYLLEMDNEIAFDPATIENVNLEATRRLGTDIAVTAALFDDRVSARAGYSYVHATFTEGPNEDSFVPLVPKHSGKLGLSVALPFELSLSGSSNVAGAYYIDAANEAGRHFPRAVIDASLGWSPDFVPGEGKLYVAVKNITNDRNPTAAFYDSFADEVSVYPQQGRSWNAGLTWSY